MIDFNDPYVILMTGLIVIIAFGAYLAFFTKLDKKR